MLDKTANINKWRKDFMIEVFMLFLSTKVSHNLKATKSGILSIL
jgi:uncharacterized membrane protein